MLLEKHEVETGKTKYVTHIYKNVNVRGEEYIDGCLWADGGHTSLLSGIFKSLEEFREKEAEAKANFEKGLIRCAGCGKVVEYNPIRYNRYFAGIYCTHCWETEYKEIEARETYN